MSTHADTPGGAAIARCLDTAVQRALALGERGLQIAVYGNGELLAETAAGCDASTLFPIFSVSKAVVATALHLQAERGLLRYEDRVAQHWPEFAANGKGETTVRDVLTHRAGLPAVPPGATMQLMADWGWMVDQLASATPLFPPGTVSTYHSLTWGWLVGELVRRTDGCRRSLGRFIAEELCAPLGIEHLHLGLPADLFPRVAHLVSDETRASDETPLRLAVKPPAVALTPEVYNRPEVWSAEHPGTGMIADARSVARLFAMLANGGALDGVRLLSPGRVHAFLEARANPDEVDRVSGRATRIGIGGYWLSGGHASNDAVTGGGDAVLYHPGQGGSIAWADLSTGLAVAVCHNRMFDLATHPARHPFAGLGESLREHCQPQAG